jgi:hypothetical protein
MRKDLTANARLRAACAEQGVFEDTSPKTVTISFVVAHQEESVLTLHFLTASHDRLVKEHCCFDLTLESLA